MATANTAIKISQLPNIGNALAPNTLLPVVNLAGTAITQKANAQIIGNLILAGAGTANFVPAGLANLAYSVANSYQPNITRVGNLNINTFRVTGGVNGQYLQTDGTGTLSWVSGGGSGNGEVGGSNGQIQFNNSGNFDGSSLLRWDQPNAALYATNFVASSALIYGNVNAITVNISSNVVSNAIYTDNYRYANGAPFIGSGAGGATGATGPSGGPVGATGATGATGAIGEIGASGATGYIGTTGATGATGTVGSTGATGATGYIGTTGATGATGEIGSTGATGATGYIGTTGATGATGTIGSTGATGATGTIGSTGATGGLGATGPAGTSVTIIGNVANVNVNPPNNPQTTLNTAFPSANNGDGVLDQATGNLWVKSSGVWNNVGNIQGPAGTTGATGIAGTNGTTGATGATGNVGSTGATGATGYIGTTGATGATGYNGSTGATGATGYIGSTGATGATGNIGSTGATGATGYIGTTGATGATGTMGSTGATGTIGSTGYEGATGATGAGSTGATGDQGIVAQSTAPSDTNILWLDTSIPAVQGVGSTGSTGATGLTGATGPSGGPIGATGSNGTNGATGATGTAGSNGATGSKGATGATGTSGTNGATGATGTSGTNGSTGATGIAGTNGSTGATGSFSGNLTANVNGNGFSISNVANITANNFSGNITITGNVTGTSSNVTLVAGSYSYIFDNTGNFTLPANSDILMSGVNSVLSANGTTLLGGYSQVGGSYSTLGVKYPGAGTQFGITLQPTNDNTTAIQFLNAAGSSIGNIKQTSSTVQFVGDGSQLSNVATTTTGSWTLAAGTNTVSLSVPLNGVYSIWVRGNIPNGIVTYTATVVVSNPNTPVVGSSYGWYYAAGNALVLTAIPTQIVGTVNNISNAVVSTTTANVFTFGITNNSGTSQVVSYGYTELG